jgi:CheY-like chemotaxis protein
MTTILIADDDDPIRETFCLLFQDEGWPVIEASTTEQALILLRSFPDRLIVLLDLSLPYKDVPLAKAIYDSPDLRRKHRYLLFTAQAIPLGTEMSQELAMVHSFASGIVPKPGGIDEALHAVQAARLELETPLPDRPRDDEESLSM